MEGKKSFVFYTDWYETFKQLPKEKGYDLLIHILSYVNDENPETDDFIVNAIFSQFKNTLKRDLEKWKKKKTQTRDAGLKSAEIRKIKLTNVERKLTNANERIKNAGVSVNVNVNDIDTINDSNCINQSNSINNINNADFKKNPLYKTFVNIYFDWFKKQTGIEPKFTGADGKAIKRIILYFQKVSNKDPADGWEYILNNSDKWKQFYQDQRKVNQIESNLVNIIADFKNGKSIITDRQKHNFEAANSAARLLKQKYADGVLESD